MKKSDPNKHAQKYVAVIKNCDQYSFKVEIAQTTSHVMRVMKTYIGPTNRRTIPLFRTYMK